MKTLNFDSLELNSTTEIKDLGIFLKTYYKGTDTLAYEVFLNSMVLFSGNDYRPSPLDGIETLDAVLGLLGFISVGYDDTDNEYFDNYTPEQIAFRDSYTREQLSLLVSDLEDRDSEYHNNAMERVSHQDF